MKNLPVFLAALLCVFAIPDISHAQGPTMCTMQYQPVCGTEKGVHKTYGNSCVLGVEGAVYQHEGECTSAELEGRQEGTYTPPAHCTAWNDGCNSCGRSADGQSYCTLMACMGESRAGYCTAYGDSVTGDSKPAPDTAVSSPVNPAPPVSEGGEADTATSAASSTPQDPGFLVRMWSAITSWFSGFFSS